MNVDDLLAEFLETTSFDEVRDWRAMPELGEEEELRGLGGPGSGNFGHAGRPGEVGGSGGKKQSPKNVYEIGVVSQGNVETRKLSDDDLVSGFQHADLGWGIINPAQRFRFDEGEIQWNETPSEEDYFKVDDLYREHFKNISHSVFNGQDFDPLLPPKPKTLGGPGSGNFGHAGRPGQIGGSAPLGEGYIVDKARIRSVKSRANDIAELMGVDPKIINVVDKEPRTFVVGGQEFKEAGHFDPTLRKIEVNARNSYHPEMNVTYGIVAHEVSHAVWNAVQLEQAREHAEISALPKAEFEQLFRKGSGYVRPEMQAQVHQRWPVSAFMYKHVGDSLMETEDEQFVSGKHESRFIRNVEKLKQDDGISAYSKAYWEPSAVNSSGGFERAVNETLAEATRLSLVPEYVTEHDPYMGTMTRAKAIKPSWREFSKDLQELVKTHVGVRSKVNRKDFTGN